MVSEKWPWYERFPTGGYASGAIRKGATGMARWGLPNHQVLIKRGGGEVCRTAGTVYKMPGRQAACDRSERQRKTQAAKQENPEQGAGDGKVISSREDGERARSYEAAP